MIMFFPLSTAYFFLPRAQKKKLSNHELNAASFSWSFSFFFVCVCFWKHLKVLRPTCISLSLLFFFLMCVCLCTGAGRGSFVHGTDFRFIFNTTSVLKDTANFFGKF